MRHLDEGTIHAWLDGALSSDEAARAEAHVASCTVCADAVAEARGLIAASSRILLALDDVPSVRGARGAEGARWGRRSLATWLVRERIAAVVALVVAGGALAVMMSRDASVASRVEMASAPTQTLELAAADSPTPPPVAAPEPQQEVRTLRDLGGRGAAASSSRARDVAVARPADSVPASVFANVEVMPTEAAAAPPVRTDDTLRSITIAQAQRQEQELSAEAKSSVSEKLTGVLPRRRAAADASQRFAEPRAAQPRIGGVVGGAATTGDARLVQEERMTEGGREIRRRIYRVDGILVTLDERLSGRELEERRPRPEANAAVALTPFPAAPAPLADSVAESTNTVRWTDARGAELTLTGPASPARLERIRQLLGY